MSTSECVLGEGDILCLVLACSTSFSAGYNFCTARSRARYFTYVH